MRIINFAASKKQEGVKKYAKAPLWRTFLQIRPDARLRATEARTRRHTFLQIHVVSDIRV